MTETAKRSVYDRVLAVAKEVGKIHATGVNQQGKAAVSVYDIENQLRDKLAAEGVLTRWSRVSMERYSEPTRNGQMTMFALVLRVRFVNIENPEDFFEDEWEDVGNNPAAAASFVRKGYYKALLHLAEEGDDKVPAAPQAARQGQQQAAQAKPPAPKRVGEPAVHVDEAGNPVKCPGCGEGDLVEVHLDNGWHFTVCSTRKSKTEGCQYRPPKEGA